MFGKQANAIRLESELQRKIHLQSYWCGRTFIRAANEWPVERLLICLCNQHWTSNFLAFSRIREQGFACRCGRAFKQVAYEKILYQKIGIKNSESYMEKSWNWWKNFGWKIVQKSSGWKIGWSLILYHKYRSSRLTKLSAVNASAACLWSLTFVNFKKFLEKYSGSLRQILEKF